MRIEHVALWAEDLERMRAFYERYFGARAGEKYRNPTTGFESYFLRFADGCRLEIMTRGEVVPRQKGAYDSGYAHLAVTVGSRGEVDALTARLAADGHTVASGPRQTSDGYYESCVLDPEGNRVELVAEA